MIVLGIDPGSLATGYGMVRAEGGKLVCLDYGVIRVQFKATLPKRLDVIYQNLIRIAQVHRPEAAAIESLFYSKNVKTALVQGEARGVVLLACEQVNLPVHEYAPATVKQAVVGQGGAGKGQVGYMIQRLLDLPSLPPEDAADALAIALCHLHRVRDKGEGIRDKGETGFRKKVVDSDKKLVGLNKKHVGFNNKVVGLYKKLV